jgi:hypothetical protein
MKHLFEYLQVEARNLTERTNAKGEKEVDCLVKWQEADVVNGNNRLYPKKILERDNPRFKRHSIYLTISFPLSIPIPQVNSRNSSAEEFLF